MSNLWNGIIDRDAGDGHTEVHVVSWALEAHVAGFVSEHCLDQVASAKLWGTTDSMECGRGIRCRVRNPSAPCSGARTKVPMGQRGAVDGRWLDGGSVGRAVHRRGDRYGRARRDRGGRERRARRSVRRGAGEDVDGEGLEWGGGMRRCVL